MSLYTERKIVVGCIQMRVLTFGLLLMLWTAPAHADEQRIREALILPTTGPFADTRVRQALAMMWNMPWAAEALGVPVEPFTTFGGAAELPTDTDILDEVTATGVSLALPDYTDRDARRAFSRRGARAANSLLIEAGLTLNDIGLFELPDGSPFCVQFSYRGVGDFAAAIGAFIESLKTLGLCVSPRFGGASMLPNDTYLIEVSIGPSLPTNASNVEDWWIERWPARGEPFGFGFPGAAFVGFVVYSDDGTRLTGEDRNSVNDGARHSEMQAIRKLAVEGRISRDQANALADRLLFSEFYIIPFREF